MEGSDRAAPAGHALASGHAGLVRAFFARRCASPEDAEDLAQEVFCAVIRGASRFRGDSTEATWIFAICRHAWSSWLRAKEREARIALAAMTEAAAGQKGGDDPAGDGDPLQGLGLDLSAALEALGPAERRLYSLYYREDRRVREIAAILGKPEGTVKYLLSRLRDRIRRELG